MTPETDCPKPSDTIKLRTESSPFSAIPDQSRLFIRYQQDPVSLRRYYPNAVASHTQIADLIPEVLNNYKTDRTALCDALEEINSGYGASEKVMENIRLLRQPDAVAVVTGQQAGLFSGPIYTIHKALSAIKMAECLTARGFKAVPVFWAATEDHDFAEVAEAFVIDAEGKLLGAKFSPDLQADLPVGNIKIDATMGDAIETFFSGLPTTEFTDGLRKSISECWHEGAGFGSAFGKFLVKLLGRFGLVVIDPLHAGIKSLAAPIYVDAIRSSQEIVSSIVERSSELEREGYHAQVLVTGDYFPLFWHTDSGQRRALRKAADNIYRAAGEKREFTLAELAETAATEPSRFSPGVMLRPVVQDHLLPTVCYFGGGAEIAYFAQNSDVCRILGRPVTPILHRQSFTVIEAKHARTLDRYGLTFDDLFAGTDSIIPRVIEESIDPELAKVFAEAEEKINIELNRLDQTLAGLDVTLAENLATRRRKVLYHIGALRKKAYFARIRKDETIHRRIESAFAAIMPRSHLQERTLNISGFLNRYGEYFIDWLYGSIDLDDKGHRIVYL